MKATIHYIKHRCFYCGSTWGLIRWTTVLPGGSSRWVCLIHTRKHLKETA